MKVLSRFFVLYLLIHIAPTYSLYAPQPQRRINTPEFLKQQERDEYAQLLQNMGLLTAPISPQNSPAPHKSPSKSVQLIKRVRSVQR